jgi:hypothetical protein
MSEQQFAEELAKLVLRATPWLPTKAIMEILRDEAFSQEGAIIKQTLDAGPWPPIEPAHAHKD